MLPCKRGEAGCITVFVYPSQYLHIRRSIYISLALFTYPSQYLHILRSIYISFAVFTYPSQYCIYIYFAVFTYSTHYLHIPRTIYISLALFIYPSQYLCILHSIYKYSRVQQFWHKQRPIYVMSLMKHIFLYTGGKDVRIIIT